MHETPRVPRLQRLQWKLTLSYVLVTVAGVVTIEIVLFGLLGSLVLWSSFFPRAVLSDVRKHAAQARPLLESVPVDRAALAAKLAGIIAEDSEPASGDEEGSIHVSITVGPPRVEAAVTDVRGVVLASSPAGAWCDGAPLVGQLPAAEAGVARAALRGQAGAHRLTRTPAGGKSAVAAPILGNGGKVIGSVYVRYRPMFGPGKFAGMLLSTVLPSAVVVAVLSAVAGTLFGTLTAARFTRRVETMAAAAQAWGRGDLSPSIPGSAEDELGQLGHSLNAMAKDLSGLMALRQEVAALEERNRLARDLHDTVKQQVFSIAMQLGAVRALIERDPGAARGILTEAEALAHRTQQDLAGIIQELRPPSGERTDVGAALRELAGEWSRRHGIRVELPAQTNVMVPAATGQALLRITQEALANVARHSGATEAVVRLVQHVGGLRLEVQDNGRGFDPAAPSSGMGLQSMRERAEALPAGAFAIESAAGRGSRVSVTCRVD